MPESASEACLKRILSYYFPSLKWYSNIRPARVPNKYNTTGRSQYERFNIDLENLELDGFNDALRLGIEYNGTQHSRPSIYFHGGKVTPKWWQRLLGITPKPDRQKMIDGHLAQLARDTRKQQLCLFQKVELVYFDEQDRDLQRLEHKLRNIALYGMKVCNARLIERPNDTVYRDLQRQLERIRWHEPLPQTLRDEWLRLTKPRHDKGV